MHQIALTFPDSFYLSLGWLQVALRLEVLSQGADCDVCLPCTGIAALPIEAQSGTAELGLHKQLSAVQRAKVSC